MKIFFKSNIFITVVVVSFGKVSHEDHFNSGCFLWSLGWCHTKIASEFFLCNFVLNEDITHVLFGKFELRGLKNYFPWIFFDNHPLKEKILYFYILYHSIIFNLLILYLVPVIIIIIIFITNTPKIGSI